MSKMQNGMKWWLSTSFSNVQQADLSFFIPLPINGHLVLILISIKPTIYILIILIAFLQPTNTILFFWQGLSHVKQFFSSSTCVQVIQKWFIYEMACWRIYCTSQKEKEGNMPYSGIENPSAQNGDLANIDLSFEYSCMYRKKNKNSNLVRIYCNVTSRHHV